MSQVVRGHDENLAASSSYYSLMLVLHRPVTINLSRECFMFAIGTRGGPTWGGGDATHCLGYHVYPLHRPWHPKNPSGRVDRHRSPCAAPAASCHPGPRPFHLTMAGRFLDSKMGTMVNACA